MQTSKISEQYIAAIDLGSNSFHMVIAQEGAQGNLKLVDRVREMVRLGAGLDDNGNLSVGAQQIALDCLKRFRQRLSGIPPERIRAVGTNTLRAAKNSRQFLDAAEEALGHQISVISGYEEARLVYLGAAFDLAVRGKRRLVVDIGGGSTELVVGEGYKLLHIDSLYIGCVSVTKSFFNDGKITKLQYQRAKNLIRRELEPVTRIYKEFGWQEAVGTSGTIKAADRVSRSLGLNQDWISPQGIKIVTEWMLDSGSTERLGLISEQRRPVFPGGFLILATIFEELEIERMDISQGALREGVAYDLIGRLHDEDARIQGVASLVTQFKPDLQQSQRVCQLARGFLDQVKIPWKLDAVIDEKLLVWASQLHEIGISIAYSQHHSHGAYIIENSNLDGFSRQVQRILALLVRNHRQNIDKEQILELPGEWSTRVIRLTVLLRLAVTIFRGRMDADLSDLKLTVDSEKLLLEIPKKWRRHHPLTLFDLDTEKNFLKAISYKLRTRLV